MPKKTGGLAAMAAAVLLLSAPALAIGPSPEQATWLSKATRFERQGWIYLHVEGSPKQRGFQHGYLLAKEIQESLRVRREVWKYESGLEWSWLVSRSRTLISPKVDAELTAELDGISDGLRAAGQLTSRDELITYNAFFELVGYWWPKEKKKLDGRAPDAIREACSSFIATGSATPDGGVVLGHNTWFGYPEADFNVILDLFPDRGHRILMQTLPGWIHSGTDFFITDAGLVGSETTIGGFSGFDEKGVPEFVRMRRAAQDAASIDGWISIMLRGNNGGYANAWLVGDVKSNEIARVELGLRHVGFARKKDGFFTGSNVAEDIKILRFETDTKETDIRYSNVARRVRWKQLMKEFSGKVDADAGKKFLGDHYDTYLSKEFAGGRALCSHRPIDPAANGEGTPFNPSGTFDAKVVDAKMAKQMSFAARWGSGCGTPFDAGKFLAEHPQFDWMTGILKSRASYPWVEFKAGEKKP